MSTTPLTALSTHYNLIRSTSFIALMHASLICTLPQVHAQIPDDEIIVTATKRATNIQNTPLAITALSGDFVKQANLNDVKDLITYAPGVTGNSKDSFIDALAIRGIRTQDFGVGGDPSVGFFKNGFYQGRNGAVVSSLFDMERAEILRGPQNFLFGRNAISGAISTYTKRPESGFTGGYVDAEVGSRGRFQSEGAINLPFSEKITGRISAYYSTENGYVENAFFSDDDDDNDNDDDDDNDNDDDDDNDNDDDDDNDNDNDNDDDLIAHDKWAVRGSLDYHSGPLTLELTAEYEDREQSGSIYRATQFGDNYNTLQNLFGPFTLPAEGRDINSDLALGEFDRAEVFSITLRADYDLGFATLTSQTGYKSHDYNYREDFDGTPLSINNFGLDQAGDYFEQEVRLVSDDESPFSWYIGGSYYNESLDALFTAQGDEEILCAYYYFYYYSTNLFGSCLADVYGATAVPEGLLEQGFVEGDYHGFAAFADVTYAVTEAIEINIGLRYAYDNKDFSNHALPVTSALGPFFTYSVTTNGPLSDSQSWDAFTPRFLIKYRINENHMVFASATRGYKSGGFGTFGFSPTTTGPAISAGDQLQPGDAVPDNFDAERLWSYEIGYKGKFSIFTTDLNAYYYNYKDLQLLVFQDGGGLIFNLGKVNGYGVEGKISARFNDHFDAFVSATYNETEIFDAGDACALDSCDGNNLESPKFSGSAVLNTHWPVLGGEAFASAELFWESEKGGGIENDPISIVDEFADLSLRIGFRKDDWSVTGYVENVTNALYYDQGNNNDSIIPAHFFGPSQPRTFGIRISKDFGR